MRLIEIEGHLCRRLGKDEQFQFGDYWTTPRRNKQLVWQRIEGVAPLVEPVVGRWPGYQFARPVDPLIVAMLKVKRRRKKCCK